MKSRKGPISLIVMGSLLALGPMWGVLGTVIGMIRAFDTIQQTGAGTPERLASDIGVSLYSTAAGMIMFPVGLALLVVGIVWLVRINRHEKASTNKSSLSPGSSAQVDLCRWL